MAITSIGYDGTVDEAQWATLSASLGTPYSVADAGHWAVTIVGGQDRTVSVAAGSGFGRGVYDTSDAPVALQAATLASGTRWDTVVMRRNWSTNVSAFAIVTGTASQAVTRTNTTPGSIDDQPIALVQITAGNTTPTALVDYRVWSSSVLSAPTLTALQAVPGVAQGREGVALDTGYRYRRESGAWTLDRSAAGGTLSPFVQTGGSILTATAGWTGASMNIRGARVGNLVQLFIELRRSGADTSMDSDATIATILPAWRPDGIVNGAGSFISSATTFGLLASLGPDGTFQNNAGASIYRTSDALCTTQATSWSIRATFTFIQAIPGQGV